MSKLIKKKTVESEVTFYRIAKDGQPGEQVTAIFDGIVDYEEAKKQIPLEGCAGCVITNLQVYDVTYVMNTNDFKTHADRNTVEYEMEENNG